MNLKYTFHTSCKVTCRIFCCKLSKFLFYNSATSIFDCPLLQILQIAVQGKIFASWHFGQLFLQIVGLDLQIIFLQIDVPVFFYVNWLWGQFLQIDVDDNFFCKLLLRTIFLHTYLAFLGGGWASCPAGERDNTGEPGTSSARPPDRRNLVNLTLLFYCLWTRMKVWWTWNTHFIHLANWHFYSIRVPTPSLIALFCKFCKLLFKAKFLQLDI